MLLKTAVRCLLLLVLFFGAINVSASVKTVDDISHDGIYIAGNPDFYPVEYYNEESKSFEGIMPSALRAISERTGLDFVYLYDKEKMQTELAEYPEISVVSAYMIGAQESYARDEVAIFSYEQSGKLITTGLAFTETAPSEVIELIKAEVGKISKAELDGYIINSQKRAEEGTGLLAVIPVLISILLLCVIIALRRRLGIMEKRLLSDRITDDETGIGNLTYFESCFNKIVNSEDKCSYNLAYIITDSNFLSAYRIDTPFSATARYVAEVVDGMLEEEDKVARISESGFAVLYSRSSEEEERQFINELLSRLNGQSEDKAMFYAAVYKLLENDYNSELLIFNLRRMCNKIVGTNEKVAFCDINDMYRIIEGKQLVDDITDGLKNKEFELFLQFIVSNETKRIVSCEALSRWKRNGEIIPPGKYIGVMEETGLIKELDFYMFEMASRQLHKWHDTELGGLSISCNMTRITLSGPDYLDRIKRIASKYIFERGRLVIEITEEAIEEDFKTSLTNVLESKKLGFRIALDDMGSGYTSMSNLCDYPIDVVKIDRSILLKTDTQRGRDLFEGMVALAHNLEKTVVCEGVETEEQNSFVSQTSCDYIQGFYYSGVFAQNECRARYNDYNSRLEQ